jgi:hypothetical protein
MLAQVLGRFADRRLEKGGPSCTRGWLSWAVGGFGFGGLAGRGLGRSA